MANTRLIFQGENKGELECFTNANDHISIKASYSGDDIFELRIVSLDVSTAIKLSKVLRGCINELKSEDNGSK